MDVALLEHRVPHHRAKRRGERHGEAERDAVPHQTFHHVEQRQVGFRNCLVKPVFLQKLRVFRMPDKRQVGVKNRGNVSERHNRGIPRR